MAVRAGLLHGSNFFRNGLELFVNRAEETFELEYHKHDFYEIAYVSEGRGYHHLGGRVIPVSKGDVFLLPIGLSHVFRPSSSEGGSRLVVLNCVFSEALLQTASTMVPDLDFAGLFAEEGGIIRDNRLTLEPLYQRMLEEYTVQPAGSAGMLLALFVQLMIQLSRLIRQSGAQTPGTPPDGSDPIEEAVDYIAHHAAEYLTIGLLANRCGMSERHFCRLFKARTGQSFLEYVHHQRVRMGCELLLGTRHKVGAIAGMVGYRDVQSFHLIFKRIVGLTPGAYRKMEGNRRFTALQGRQANRNETSV